MTDRPGFRRARRFLRSGADRVVAIDGGLLGFWGIGCVFVCDVTMRFEKPWKGKKTLRQNGGIKEGNCSQLFFFRFNLFVSFL